MIAMSIQDELADMGFLAALAQTEAQAVALAEARCPDLIIADVKLVEGSGIDAVRRICGDREIPVIVMTGAWEAPGGTIGEAAVLPKPFTSVALRSAVAAAGPAISKELLTVRLPYRSLCPDAEQQMPPGWADAEGHLAG